MRSRSKAVVVAALTIFATMAVSASAHAEIRINENIAAVNSYRTL